MQMQNKVHKERITKCPTFPSFLQPPNITGLFHFSDFPPCFHVPASLPSTYFLTMMLFQDKISHSSFSCSVTSARTDAGRYCPNPRLISWSLQSGLNNGLLAMKPGCRKRNWLRVRVHFFSISFCVIVAAKIDFYFYNT